MLRQPQQTPVRVARDFQRSVLTPREDIMIVADLSVIEGRRCPARRLTQNLVGGAWPQCTEAHFATQSPASGGAESAS